jgi:hypothetical protein
MQKKYGKMLSEPSFSTCSKKASPSETIQSNQKEEPFKTEHSEIKSTKLKSEDDEPAQ